MGKYKAFVVCKKLQKTKTKYVLKTKVSNVTEYMTRKKQSYSEGEL